MRFGILAILGGLLFFASDVAQAQPWKFQWQPGQVLHYRVEHVTSVSETVAGSKVQTSSKLKLLKQWKVLNVDANGVATMQMSLVAMRNEQVTPSGQVLLFDSNNLDKSTPSLKEHMTKFINTPLAELRIDATGKVIGVKQGNLDRYEAEPPFQLILAGAVINAGQPWERPFTIVLNPPLGTGEKFQAVQKYQCQEIKNQQAKILLKTEIKNLPASLLDQVPLFAKQPEGEILFDISSGRLHSAHLRILRDLENHQGKGSTYHFESDYREEFVPAAKLSK